MGKTLENIFIEQYEDMKEKLSQANKTIFELSNKRKIWESMFLKNTR